MQKMERYVPQTASCRQIAGVISWNWAAKCFGTEFRGASRPSHVLSFLIGIKASAGFIILYLCHDLL